VDYTGQLATELGFVR